MLALALPLLASQALALVVPDAHNIFAQDRIESDLRVNNPDIQGPDGLFGPGDDVNNDDCHGRHYSALDDLDSQLSRHDSWHVRFSRNRLMPMARRLINKPESEQDQDPVQSRIFGSSSSDDRCGRDSATIYDLITSSKHTTKLAKVVREDKELAQLLRNPDANLTLFVTPDKVIPHMSKDHEPSKETMRHIVQYHIVPHVLPAWRVLVSYTMSTYYRPDSLGGRPQRLTTRLGLRGATINHYSHVTAANIKASNGIMHAVDRVFYLPPSMFTLFRALPDHFSTFNLALEHSGLAKDLKDDYLKNSRGATVFAPSNAAFAKLGPRVNAFLFSDRGKKYLAALLKYHISLDNALYSDTYYHEKRGKGHGMSNFGEDTWQITDDERMSMPSLLGKEKIKVDVRRFGPYIQIHVDGRTAVSSHDIVSAEGVVQETDKVLMPRCGRCDSYGSNPWDDMMSVDKLKKRLEPLMEEGNKWDHPKGDKDNSAEWEL